VSRIPRIGTAGRHELEYGSVDPARRSPSVGDAHLPLRHAVLGALRDRIIAGDWAPGERLYEDQIASELDVSRNPVREALQALAGEGFVELEPRRGARVAVMPPGRVHELFEVREALEGLVASLAAVRRSDADIERLRAVTGEGEHAARAGDLAQLPALNTRFHEALADAACNQMLRDTIERLRHLIEWIYSQRIQDRAPQSWSEYAEIVDAIDAGDARAAERVARNHIARARSAYLDQRP
jgi:DNA-binding GntR family transcriptional regulator